MAPISLSIEGSVARIVVDRPEARNAMSFAMYDALLEMIGQVSHDTGIRCLVISGNDTSFIAGTDISEFAAVRNGADGLAYEARVETVISALEALTIPTIAAIRGVAAGGGLVIAAVCDLRLMECGARVGVPIARTVGNCLSSRNLHRLERVFGLGSIQQMLLAAEMLDAKRCHDLGFATWLADSGDFATSLDEKLNAVLTGAPLTLTATKSALSRIGDGNLADADLLDRVYGSDDFSEGISAFHGKRRAAWSGR